MIPSFFQKPFGAITLLTAAVGGPYAAFETDFGTSIRKSLITTSASPQGDTGGNAWEHAANDPASLNAIASTYGGSSIPNGDRVSLDHRVPQGQLGQQGHSGQSVHTGQQTQQGQLVSQVYGPATVYPIPNGQTMQSGMMPGYHSNASDASQFYSQLGAQPIEQRSGPATAISGHTAQLWDYTLGTPSLSHLQQHSTANIGGGTVVDLREVLRFDITPGWLPQRFARVTTITSEIQMDGLRVPLITGTRPSDIAGSLTYFFDATQSLKRIQLHGITGDPTGLAQLMVNYYQLKPEQSLGGQLFTSRWNNHITSVMQIAPTPIIYAGADHSKYILFLELNQPSTQYGLSREASDILTNARATQRWQ